jgi:two-component system, NarL family, sensor kinase
MAGSSRANIQSLLTPISREYVFRRYGVALTTAILGVILRWLLDPVLGHVAFYVTIYVAVAYCALVCGYAPATLTALVGFVGIFYWFVDPRHTVWPVRPSEVHGVVGFFLVCTVFIALGEANRRQRMRLDQIVKALRAEVGQRQQAEQELRTAHDELEQRVLSRTHDLSRALARLKDEVTVREHTEERLRHLSLRLMTLQDEERRHIARELHDTCGQTLAAIKMSIALVRQKQEMRPETKLLIDDLNALADEALREVRTMSYLLHPPLLDEAGIASAARWFVEGFSRRSGIAVQCDIPERMERPSRICELVLFRVLQESLTNVHRHSGASAASIRLERSADSIELQITDNGRGIPPERLGQLENSVDSGVGIAGMRERVRELGGQFEIRPLNPGTSINVILPLQAAAVFPESSSMTVSR